MCVTVTCEDENNHSQQEKRSLRRAKADTETRCRTYVRSVIEVSRETHILSHKNHGNGTTEQVIYLYSHKPNTARADKQPFRSRRYWDIESDPHQRLDVSAGEDSSRVPNRYTVLVLGIIRRNKVGQSYTSESGRKNVR